MFKGLTIKMLEEDDIICLTTVIGASTDINTFLPSFSSLLPKNIDCRLSLIAGSFEIVTVVIGGETVMNMSLVPIQPKELAIPLSISSNLSLLPLIICIAHIVYRQVKELKMQTNFPDGDTKIEGRTAGKCPVAWQYDGSILPNNPIPEVGEIAGLA
jgi:hypothetical protein